ncbi:hypothetical protein GCM10011611_17320 [Aliidongia dinghuensis]|uniref:Uncharacterized protein n=1 Tax=Aliidongia dinghuensis TaxID=1867774 RepID=A0A8J2YT96_9PROT|nr:hypothetical protein GCM10011611_17320 [Aliidongia dinghuensis]
MGAATPADPAPELQRAGQGEEARAIDPGLADAVEELRFHETDLLGFCARCHPDGEDGMPASHAVAGAGEHNQIMSE